MSSSPDPLQEWAGLWLQAQQRYWSDGLRALNPRDPDPDKFAALTLQAWQQSCELWLSAMQAALPAEVVDPVAAVLRQSQEDIHRARDIAAQHLERVSRLPRAQSGYPSLSLDWAELAGDPIWREHLQACDAFVRFHTSSILEALSSLKARLAEQPPDTGTALTLEMAHLTEDYQARLHSEEYGEILERLAVSLAALQNHS